MVIRWSRLAVQSLREIYLFYLPQTGRSKARIIVNELRDETRFLLIFPEIGSRELVHGADHGYRYIIKGHYKIYYTVEPDYIRIAFVWDTRRNPKLLLNLLK